MKKYFYIFSCLSLAVIFTACKEEDYASKEYYKNVVYLLSKESYNVYSEVYPLNDGNEVTGYFSIGCGGARSNADEFIVELEPDQVLMEQYNRGNFDVDASKYAKLLPENRYKLETYKITFPANNPDQYVKVAVSVLPDGLSPDSTYFIPLTIKNVSKYEVNPEKANILFRILLENYYAEQLKDTYYQLKGNIMNASGEATSGIAGTKMVRPLTKNSVRVYAGNEIQTNKSTVDEINKFSVILTINENNQVQITPYGSIQIEQIAATGWNIYEEVRRNAVDETVDKYFLLYYRYRTIKTPASEGKPAEYNNWIIVQETLKKLEN